MEAVRINELSMGYRDTLVLDDLELAIPAGSMVGLLGPNGAGKTTLLKILAGLEMAYQGEVKICGSVPGPTSKAKVSYQPDHLPLAKDMRVKETTALYETFFEDFDTKRANFMIRRLGLDRESRIREMSKGMRDKLQIALTLSRRAEV